MLRLEYVALVVIKISIDYRHAILRIIQAVWYEVNKFGLTYKVNYLCYNSKMAENMVFKYL